MSSCSSNTNKIPIGTLLFKRLSKVTKSVFGVPGDFNLRLLEQIYQVPELEWVGNNNELNAAYTADGYSRINPHNFSCLVTTYGVGELSALNGIAGSFAENVAVLHIVGSSALRARAIADDGNEMDALFGTIHHLVPGKHTFRQDHDVYSKAVEAYSCYSEYITEEDILQGNVQKKIDEAIEAVVANHKPGYLFVPSDVADSLVTCDLERPLDLHQYKNKDLNLNEEKVLDLLLEKVYKSENPGFVADYFLKRHTSQVIDLLNKTNWDCYSTPASRGLCLDETLKNFKGVFCNEKSPLGVFESIKKHDLVLHFGSKINETTFRYSGTNPEINEWLADQDICFLGKDFAMIGFKKELIKNISGCKVFNRFLEVLDYNKIKTIVKSEAEQSKGQLYSDSYKLEELSKDKNRLYEQQVSYELSKNILQKGDILMCEMSSFAFELENIKLPSEGKIICQSFYASIGYALPATVGVCKALKDYKMDNRVVLLQGDGSAQMTLQELSLFLKYDLNPMILMINNSGYTIERAIIGATSSYNDLTADWDWQKMLEAFGDSKKDKHETFKIHNYDEFKNYISQKGTKPLNKLHMVELILDKFDYGNGLLIFLGKKKADE